MNNDLTTQRNKIIKLLQEAGEQGVRSFTFTYNHNIKQCPTRIFELKKLGFNIISKPFKNSVIYILSNLPIGHIPDVTKKVQQWEIEQEQMNNQVKVVKNGRIYWNDREEPKQYELLQNQD